MCMDDCDSILIVCICWCIWVVTITVHQMKNIKFWKKFARETKYYSMIVEGGKVKLPPRTPLGTDFGIITLFGNDMYFKMKTDYFI